MSYTTIADLDECFDDLGWIPSEKIGAFGRSPHKPAEKPATVTTTRAERINATLRQMGVFFDSHREMPQ
ncbi:hypothetical protein CCP3SC1_1740002 [Gammaproteobacteria bacterium]